MSPSKQANAKLIKVHQQMLLLKVQLFIGNPSEEHFSETMFTYLLVALAGPTLVSGKV